MSDIHYFQRYSEKENVVTNNTLLLFSRLYNASPQKFSSFLKELLELPENIVGARFSQQIRTKGVKGIPDAEIFQESFRLLVETKLYNERFDSDQLKRHTEHFKQEESKVLLLLSPEEISKDKLSKLKDEIVGKENDKKIIVHSCGFKDVISKFRDEIDPFDRELNAVLDDFSDFCAEADLLSTRESVMRIVPCGQSIQENLKLSVYFAPSRRNYSPHTYIGVYNQKMVRGIGKITAVADVDLDKSTLAVRKLITGNLTEENKKNIKTFMEISPKQYGWDIEKNMRFFCVDKFFPTEFQKSSAGGIQGPRIFDLNTFIKFKNSMSTEEIANQLRGKS